ncbi:hypothetical protein ACFQRK_06130 [Parapedobacter sp. GCM10030251]|uniref:hypothetical protein n=1 Tax=Parapedobacter sp. GCM10030251 TaxID=3273419 RepID=UPI00360CDAAB
MQQTKYLLAAYNIGITLLCGFLILTGFNHPNDGDEITVKRINIVNEDGTPAIILANQERVPDPVLDGQSYKRAIKAGGIVTNRLQLGTNNGTTALVINGTDGKPRVKLAVSDRNEVSFSVLDENGNTIKQILE